MSPFERLQLDAEGYLLSHPELQYLTITRVRPRTAQEATQIQSRLDKALGGLLARNGKRGLAAILHMPYLGDAAPNVRSITGKLVLEIDVIENVLINMGGDGTGVSAEEVALGIAELLQHQQFTVGAPLVGQPRLITPRPEEVVQQRVAYRIALEVPHQSAAKPKVATPALTQAGAVITLTCSTAGAAIHYTLDGSFPGTAATAYSAPLTLAPGTHTLRYAAYLTGHAGSITCQQTVVVA